MRKLLSLFTGYGGLDMAVMALTGAELVGVSDIDKGPCAVLAHYHPDVPNLGDIKAIDWDSDDVPAFDILTGGYPCQPFSSAGHRRGVDDPRHLWPYVLEAIKARRPGQVYLENVRGHLSLGFNVVLKDLASAGYAVYWSIMAASSVGAAHRRERLYIYATPTDDGAPYEVDLPDKVPTAGRIGPDGLHVAERVDANFHSLNTLLPTPVARDHKGATKRKGGLSLGDVTRLFPTPKYNDGVMGRPRTKDRPIEKSTHLGTIVTLLPSALARQLPTPNTMDHLPARDGEPAERQLRRGQGPNASRRSSMGNLREDIITTVDPERYGGPARDLDAYTWAPFNTGDWGIYAEAVARWALSTGNMPPAPVQPNRNGNPQLTAAFPAWLMGLPNGYFTDPDIGLTRTEAIKLAGNGVVPQAAAVAYDLIHRRYGL